MRAKQPFGAQCGVATISTRNALTSGVKLGCKQGRPLCVHVADRCGRRIMSVRVPTAFKFLYQKAKIIGNLYNN